MLHDHHLHPLGYAQLVNGLELFGAADFEDLKARIAARAATIEGAIIGQRLNDEGLVESRLPTKMDIDEAVPDRPVLLYRYCGHIAVANSAALDLAGVDESTPDPAGGSIDRDASGAANGILRETATLVVGNALAPHTIGPTDAEIITALGRLTEYGLGSITGMVSTSEPMWCGVADELGTLCRLAPELPVDVDVYVITDNPSELGAAAERIGNADGRVRFSGWKGFADGSLGGHTAAMYEPFSDSPGNTGTLRLDFRHTVTMARAALDLGGGVAVHAIGDRANDAVLDVFDLLVTEGRDPSLLRVEHASVLGESTIERMAGLGVTASVQPAFLASEDWLPKRLGEARMEKVYPFRSLLEAGIQVIGGSDSPVELPDPEVGIRAAVDRYGLNQGQAMTEAQARALFAPPTR
jgi:predicted amidohydrolase YtcJ